MNDSYMHVCVAGTFDGLHAGHEALLRRAFAEGSHVLIGMTSDEYVRAHKHHGIRSFIDRKQSLISWIEQNGFASRYTIVSIDDPFEPAASDSSLEALIVSSESKGNGEELNKRRIARGLLPLTLHVVPLVPAEDMHPISSTRMRAGEIDRDGSLLMPEALRNNLSMPLGRVLTDEALQDVFIDLTRPSDARVVITVGDMTTKTFLDAGITPYLMVVDHKINRVAFSELQPIYEKRGFKRYAVQSGPGYISREAITYITQFLHAQPQGSSVLEVEGEEDLLTIPVVIEAPPGAIVYYGQPGVGVVEVVVTKEKQLEAKRLLSQFIV